MQKHQYIDGLTNAYIKIEPFHQMSRKVRIGQRTNDH